VLTARSLLQHRGWKVNRGTSKSLTLRGPRREIQAHPDRERSGIVSVREFGAKGDGESDDTDAIEAAIASLGRDGVLDFPRGTYLISRELQGRSNLEISGTDATITSRTEVRSFFYFRERKNIAVSGCTFDMNMGGLPTYAYADLRPKNVALFFDHGCEDVVVRNNRFVNLYSNAVRFYQTIGQLKVLDNEFSSTVQTQMFLLEHLFFTTIEGDVVVRGNRFVNAATDSPASAAAGIFLSGTKGSVVIDRNSFDYCGRDNTGHHRVGVIDFYGNSENVVVSNNTSINTMAQFLRLASSWPAQIFSNKIVRNEKAGSEVTMVVGSTAEYQGVGRVGAVDVEIFDNELIAGTNDDYGMAIVSYDYSVPSRDIRLHGNSFVNFKVAVGIGGPFKEVSIAHNSIGGTKAGTFLEVLNTGTHITIGSARGVGASEGTYDDLAVVGNVVATGRADATPIVLNFVAAAPFPKKIGTIAIRDNAISGAEGSVASAVTAVTAAEPYSGTLLISGNRIQRFGVAFYVRRFERLRITGNETKEITRSTVVESFNGTVEL
jgi:hypothetical protein